ncbi:hypothetical protein B484DRAFT_441755, partial [Ochromonadaceae sp. CCMP2298]
MSGLGTSSHLNSLNGSIKEVEEEEVGGEDRGGLEKDTCLIRGRYCSATLSQGGATVILVDPLNRPIIGSALEVVESPSDIPTIPRTIPIIPGKNPAKLGKFSNSIPIVPGVPGAIPMSKNKALGIGHESYAGLYIGAQTSYIGDTSVGDTGPLSPYASSGSGVGGGMG